MTPTRILYIPGLGDRYDPMRRFFLRFWRVFGITTTLVPMHWESRESYDDKLQRLLDAVDSLQHARVVIIGESAGGAMALTAYAARPNVIYKAMTLCGKNLYPERVAPHYYRKNPAFKQALHEAQIAIKNLPDEQRRRFVSFVALIDHVVPKENSHIPGCRQVRLWSVGHLTTIFFALTVAAPLITRIAKR